MRKILLILILISAGFVTKAQTNPFPTLDSLERFVNRYIRNSPVEAFQNLRMNTVLIGLKRFIQNSALGGGVDTLYTTNDSTLRLITFAPDTFDVVIKGTGGITNTNAGLGFRVLKPSTQEIKTLFSDITGRYDSTSNTNGITYKVDTLFMTTRAWDQKGKDSLSQVLRDVIDDTAQAIRDDFPAGGGGGDEDSTILRRPLYVDTAAGSNPDTMGIAQEEYSLSEDQKLAHAVRYVSNAGNNSNNGETEATPKQTLTQVATDLNSLYYGLGRAHGVLRANDHFREMADFTSPNLSLSSYNLFGPQFQKFAIINGADVHNSGWTLAAGARYTKNITLSIGSNYGYDNPLVIEIDTLLEKTDYWGARKDLQWVSSTALVESTPGSFHNANLTNPVTIHIHASDGSAPGSNRFRYEVATRRNGVSASTGLAGLNLQRLIFLISGGGYGSIGAATGGGAYHPYVGRCIFAGAGTHAIVSQGGIYENCLFMGATRGLTNGSIAGAFYKDDGTGINGIVRKTIFLNHISAWTAHEGAPVSELEHVQFLNNYWFSDTTYAGTVWGSEFVKRLDIIGNYMEEATSVVVSAADTLNVIGNIARIIKDESRTSNSTAVFSRWLENVWVFTPPSSGITRTAIKSMQTTDSFIVRNNTIHMNSPNDQAEASVVLARTTTFAAPTKTDFSYNIVIGQAPAGRRTKPYVVDQGGIEDAAAGIKADFNVYILLSGAGFHWVNLNPFGGGDPNSFSLSDWQSRTTLEANSVYIDLSSDPLGLKKIFEDPDNGNWTLTNSTEANQIRALLAGVTNPPLFYPSRPSQMQAAATVQNGDNIGAVVSDWQHGRATGGGSGEANTASNVGTGVGPFKQKTGVNLEFKSFTEPGSIDVVSNTNDIAFQLVNDNATPGNDKVYRTNGSGVKVWGDFPAGGTTDTTRFWHINGNSLAATAKLGSTTINSYAFITNNIMRGAVRYFGGLVWGDTVGTTVGRLATFKNTSENVAVDILGPVSGTQPALNVQTTHTATANNQTLIGFSMTPVLSNGGFTGIAARILDINPSLASGNVFGRIGNTGASGTAEFHIEGSNGAWRATSAGRAWATAGNNMITPASANFQIMMEKSFAVVGANFDSSGLNLGDGTRAGARLAIRGNKSQNNWGLTGIQSAFIGATYTDVNTNGTVTHTAINGIGQSTIANVAASTHTNASTLYIANAPAAGTNATITNPWSIYVAAGKSFHAGEFNIGSATDQGSFTLQNTGGLYQSGTTRINLGSDATGDIHYRNSSGDQTRLGIGTANQLLRTNSGATAPEWFTPTYISSGSGGYVDQGTYTPTLTSVANVDATTALSCQWIRVGNVVHVSGAFDLDATTTATITQVGISLPVSTAIAEEFHCGGTANATATSVTETGNIRADVTNSRVEFRVYVTATSNQRWFFTFTYRIIPA